MPAVLVFLLSVLGVVPAPVPAACLLPPVPAPIVEPFVAPGCEWCPGHRGVEYAVAPGTLVRAAAAGRVTFSGRVVDTYYLVVEHADGLRATYGDLVDSPLHAGDVVVAGAVVGRSHGRLHFGIRQGERYLDPEPLLGRLVARARLIPTDGTPPRPAPPPRLRCPASTP